MQERAPVLPANTAGTQAKFEIGSRKRTTSRPNAVNAAEALYQNLLYTGLGTMNQQQRDRQVINVGGGVDVTIVLDRTVLTGAGAIVDDPGVGEAAMSVQSSTDEIIAASMPLLLDVDLAYRRRLQEALILCRAGQGASTEQRLRASFQLYDEELLTRGEICDMFDLDAWDFMEYADRFAAEQDERTVR